MQFIPSKTRVRSAICGVAASALAITGSAALLSAEASAAPSDRGVSVVRVGSTDSGAREKQRIIAHQEKQRIIAHQEKQRAEKQRIIAHQEKQRIIAEKQRIIAEKQRIIAHNNK
ncbi:MAG: hypothetical protein H0U47_11270 [Nocardioidaceae bacterium]|nr:hypothetical protein [Nocardioidaceae bacterium]MBA3800285.1 hypothetical protein [Geodermatophilaceae bacterium]